jgi:hypothetical protein
LLFFLVLSGARHFTVIFSILFPQHGHAISSFHFLKRRSFLSTTFHSSLYFLLSSEDISFKNKFYRLYFIAQFFSNDHFWHPCNRTWMVFVTIWNTCFLHFLYIISFHKTQCNISIVTIAIDTSLKLN